MILLGPRFSEPTALVAPQLVECPECRGRGEISTGRRERDTGAPVGATCTACSGTGQVLADDVVVTTCCEVVQWAGTACPDHDALCHEHRPRGCRDCAAGWDADTAYFARGFAS